MNLKCQIKAFGSFLPEQVVTNADLAKIVATDNKWIVERTGIEKRRRIAASDNASDLGLRAARLALDQSGITPDQLTHVIVATCTPDQLTPSTACIIAGALNAGPVMAFDIGAACTGFIYGLSLCQSIICADKRARVLFICVEALTRRLNFKDRTTCVLFGDGAVAVILDDSVQGSICTVEDMICKSDGRQKDLIIIGGGTAWQAQPGELVGEEVFLTMQGRDTYRHAVREMVNVCNELLEKNNLAIADIDLFVPHQANMRIIEAVGARLGIAADRVFTNVAEYGNTSAASIPLALAEARAANRIKPGARVLITAFGAGLTWGAGLLRF